MEINKIYNYDCFEMMKYMDANSIDFTLTDIPYGTVNREHGTLERLSSLNKLGAADDASDFDVLKFCDEVYRISKNSICIFVGKEQFSDVFNYFAQKPGTTRAIVYQKTNPVPSNGKYVYLSGIEFAVWFKKRGAKTFNAFCKNTVFPYPIFSGKKRIHPTQKHPNLFRELIEDNTNENDIVFDPCAGGGTTALAANACNRNFICFEKDRDFYNKAVEMLKREIGYKI